MLWDIPGHNILHFMMRGFSLYLGTVTWDDYIIGIIFVIDTVIERLIPPTTTITEIIPIKDLTYNPTLLSLYLTISLTRAGE